MQHNEGGVDRILRVIIGLALLTITLVIEGPARWWGLIGILPLATALMGWCPAYSLLGINTRGKEPTPPAAKT